MCKGVVGLMELDDTGAEVCVAHIQVPRLGGELVCPYVMSRNRKASDPSGRATLIPRGRRRTSWCRTNGVDLRVFCLHVVRDGCVCQPGESFNTEGLVNETYRSFYKAVTFESPLAPSADGGKGVGASAPCHLLALPVKALLDKLGSHWMLDRKRTLVTTNPQILSMFLECVPYVCSGARGRCPSRCP